MLEDNMYNERGSLETYKKRAISVGGIIGLIIIKGLIKKAIDDIVHLLQLDAVVFVVKYIILKDLF